MGRSVFASWEYTCRESHFARQWKPRLMAIMIHRIIITLYIYIYIERERERGRFSEGAEEITWRNSSRGRSGIEESPPTVPEDNVEGAELYVSPWIKDGPPIY